jgi:protein-S-isoprenylcysteine O-methyltransferase Ste14
MIEFVTAAANLILFSWFAYASFTHFNTDEPIPLGSKFISVATPVGTIVNLALWYRSPDAGDAVAVCALLLTVAGAVFFGLAKTAAPPRMLSRAFSESTPPSLVDSGIYAHVRNPLYSSYMTYWLSWTVLTQGHWIAIAIFIAMTATYIQAVRQEERQLTERLGETYTSYTKRTKRFLPWIV